MLSSIRFILLLTITWALPFQGITLIESFSHVNVGLFQEKQSIQGGHPFWVALQLNLEEGWHVYWKNPGDVGIPLSVEWTLPDGFEVGALQWPFPEKFATADLVGFGYKGEVILLSQMTPPDQLDPDAQYHIEAKVKWLVCSSSTCQPGSATATLPLVASSSEPHLREECASIFQRARANIPQTPVEVKTIRKQGIVQLEVPQEGKESPLETIQDVYFFPEQNRVIDPFIEATVIPSSRDKGHRYLVNLRGSDEIGAQSQSLKGVLVLHTENGKEKGVQAFDIDSPIIEEGDRDLVSYHSLGHSPLSIGNPTMPLHVSSSFEGGIALAFLFAFIGGMMLNLMPCVLPVISFKVMSFVKMAGQRRSTTLKHGLLFSSGVLLSFWILASAMLMLRSYGQAVGWGFQLQEPLFVVTLASLLFIFALSLFGLFEWGMSVASWAGQTEAEKGQQSPGYMSSFLSGMLATAVATPCTGPFLGSAVGFAVTLPLFQSLLIFTFLGLGMSFPYLLLAAFPSSLRFLPKPGAWMETFKQSMAFLLLVTVLWLLWVFSAQTDAFSLICLLAGFLCFSIGGWIYGKECSPLYGWKRRGFAYASVLLCAFVGCQAILFPRASWENQKTSFHHSDGWETFSPERVAELRSEGKPILIDFTAKWCLICQTNHFVLTSNEVNKRLNDSGVIKMRADWTKSDPIITQELSKFGRNSVPLYVLYGPDVRQEPLVLPQVLTPDVVVDHLDRVMSEMERI